MNKAALALHIFCIITSILAIALTFNGVHVDIILATIANAIGFEMLALDCALNHTKKDQVK